MQGCKIFTGETKTKLTRQEELCCCLTSSVAKREDCCTIKRLAYIYYCKQFACILIGMMGECTSCRKVQP